jgi:hypothetical protein
MKKILITLMIIGVVFYFTGTSSATVLTFDDESNLGVITDGQAMWNGNGGGHIYFNSFHLDDHILFSQPAYVNNFQMNGLPRESFPSDQPDELRYIDLIKIEAFDADDNSLWDEVIDLSDFKSWENWKTVSVETDNVSRLTFYATGYKPFPFGGCCQSQ